MTTKEAAEIANVALPTARKWARLNHIQYSGEDKAKIYNWTKQDIENFIHRDDKRFSKNPKEIKYVDVVSELTISGLNSEITGIKKLAEKSGKTLSRFIIDTILNSDKN